MIVDLLAKAEIEYMVSGSIASTVYGEPRTTNDIDIVIDPDERKLGTFLDLIDKGYYFSKTAAIDALKNRSMFNIIDIQCGWKIDLIIKKSRPFEILEFRRKRNAEILGTHAFIISPEDSVISKLVWAKNSQSQIQLRDTLGVLVAQWDRLDFEYLKKWAQQLEVDKTLDGLIAQAQRIRTA
jgi:hypothetical protein